MAETFTVFVSTAPLAGPIIGTEKFPLIQGGATKGFTISALFASPTFSGTVSIGTIGLSDNGNNVLVTAAGKSLGVPTTGAIQVGHNIGGPLIGNDGAADTLTVVSSAVAVPLGDCNLQVEPGVAGGQALFIATKDAGANEQHVAFGYSRTGGVYVLAQTITNAGAYIDFEASTDGSHKFFTLKTSTDGLSVYTQGNAPIATQGYTVLTLPSTAATGRVAGARAHVTDANATLAAGIGTVVATGGANVVPVFYDGTNWRIG